MQALTKEASAGYLVNLMARLFTRRMNAALTPLGLSTGPLGIMLELWREDGLSQNDLVARLDHEQATLAFTLKRMERDGLIVRRRSRTDRRVWTIHLTAAARRMEVGACALARAVNKEALSVLSTAERVLFLDMTRRIIAGRQVRVAAEEETD